MPFVTENLEILHCTHYPVIPKSDLYFTFCSCIVQGKCHFYQEGGAPENWGDQVLFLRSKRGIKRFFQIKKGGSLIFFEEIKCFVKHFRTQMEFLLILQKRCSFDSVSCWNSSKRG